MSVIDINTPSLGIAHLKLERVSRTYYDMKNEAIAIMMFDKESTRIDQRFKVVAVFKGGEVKLVGAKEPNKADMIKKIRDGTKPSKFELQSFMRDDKGHLIDSMPGFIVKIFKN